MKLGQMLQQEQIITQNEIDKYSFLSLESANYINNYIVYYFSDKELYHKLYDATDFHKAIDTIIFLNSYKYNKLFNTLDIEYDVLNNYGIKEIGHNNSNGNQINNTNGSSVASITNDTDEIFHNTDKNIAESAGTGEYENHGDYDKFRIGNFNYAPQEAIKLERENAQFNFYMILINDIINEITLSVYC